MVEQIVFRNIRAVRSYKRLKKQNYRNKNKKGWKYKILNNKQKKLLIKRFYLNKKFKLLKIL